MEEKMMKYGDNFWREWGDLAGLCSYIITNLRFFKEDEKSLKIFAMLPLYKKF